MSMNLNDLYGQVIRDHKKFPRNKGLIDGYKTLRFKNPSCGDDITVQALLEEGKIKDIRHEGSGCAICCSSASVMSEVLKNKSKEEANLVIEDFYRLIKGEDVLDEEALDEAIVYSGVAKFPARVKCATLAWKAVGAVIVGDQGEQIDE